MISPIIDHWNPHHSPDRIPKETRCRDVPGYLRECEERAALRWPPNIPQDIEQWLAAYRAGLIEARPARGELHAEHFDAIDAERKLVPDSALNRLLNTILQKPTFRKAFRVALKREGG